MNKERISNLLTRYHQMMASGKNIYFDADEYEELADYHEKKEDIDTAKNIIELGLRIHPNNDGLMLRLANYYLYESNYMAALEYVQQHFSETDFEANLIKTECFLQLGLYAEAHETTKTILNDTNTEIGEALTELGLIYLESEYFDEAILYLEKSLEYNTDNLEIYKDLVYAHEAKGQFPSAIAFCDKLLDIDPYSFSAWLTLGKLYSLEQSYEKALDAFEFALALDESNINVLKLKAHCLMMSDRFEEAITVLTESIDISPSEKILYLSMSDCYMELEQYKEMLAWILKYENIFGETIESVTKKALAFFLNKDVKLAVETLGKAFETYPDSHEVYFMAGDIYFNLLDFDTAESYLQTALSLKEIDNTEIIEKLITLYIKNKELEKAIPLQKKLTQTINDLTSKEKLALLYIEAGMQDVFNDYIQTLSNAELTSFYLLFYPSSPLEETEFDRTYILKRLNDIYESRILYKNIKY